MLLAKLLCIAFCLSAFHKYANPKPQGSALAKNMPYLHDTKELDLEMHHTKWNLIPCQKFCRHLSLLLSLFKQQHGRFTLVSNIRALFHLLQIFLQILRNRFPPHTQHLLSITSFLLFLQQLLFPLVRISLWNWQVFIFQVYFLTQFSALSVLYGYNYFTFKLSFLSHLCTWFLFNLKGYQVKSTLSSHTSPHLKLSFPRDNYWTQFTVFFKTCSFLCGEIVIQFIEKCQLIGV